MKRALLFVALAVSWPSALAAQSPVEGVTAEVDAALEAGDLITAGTALDRGLALPSLSRGELATLYTLRALLAYADDRLGLLEESLEALATLGVPTPEAFPRPLRVRYEEVLALAPAIVLSIELVPEVDGDHRTVRVVPEATGDRGHLLRSFRVLAAVNEGPLERTSPEDALDAGDPHAAIDVRYVIEALGPGGALLATRGSESAPEHAPLDALSVDETFLHVTLVTIASVIVAGAISFGMAYLATDGFTAGQATTVGPITCTGACMSF